MSIPLCRACGHRYTPPDVRARAEARQLYRMLRSNVVPPDSIALSMAASDALRQYDAEVYRAANLFATLRSKRAAIASYEARCHSLCAPIRRLPPELLVEIFEFCSLPGKERVENVSLVEVELRRLAKYDLLVLAQVSSHWHTIAMNTPRLWSTILCDTSLWTLPSAKPLADTCLSLLKTSLRRGENHPLMIELEAMRPMLQDSHQQAFMSLLSEHSSRWRKLTLWSGGDVTKYMMGAKGNLGRLEQLHLRTTRTRANIFRVAPRLKEFTFVGLLSDLPEIPWDQIHTFHYFGDRGTDPRALSFLLETNQRIRTFTFDFNLSDLRVGGRRWPPISIHSELETLQLRLAVPSGNAHILSNLLRSLTLPRLRSFSLMPRSDASAPAACLSSDFLKLADQSSFRSHLIRLELDAVIMDQALLRCLAVLPLLQELRLHDPTYSDHIMITDTLLRGLSMRTGERNLVPELAFFLVASRLQFSDGVYLQLISSRFDGIGDRAFESQLIPLEDRCRDVSPELRKQLSRLRWEEGDAICSVRRRGASAR
ncbi:hypothetical protein DFH06DRAFT_1130901 [Mycena polygramma]|nr:hypothetical protein DFH06DRAFT_1130901 [Mycena polygramma]